MVGCACARMHSGRWGIALSSLALIKGRGADGHIAGVCDGDGNA